MLATRVFASLLAMLAAMFSADESPPIPQGPCPGPTLIAHGTMQFLFVEGGCWQFVDDAGNPYEPIGGPPSLYCEGVTGQIVGCLNTDLASTCQVGQIVEVDVFTPDATFVDLGSGLEGTTEPSLVGEGAFCTGSLIGLTLNEALNDTTAWLTVGFAALNAPFKGGTLVPDINPPGFVLPIPTGPSGTVVLAGAWPAGVPSAFSMYFQFWVQDPGGPAGFSASNAVSGTTP